MPIISQWPVTESLPADASAMRPTAAAGAWMGTAPPMAATRPRPRARSVGSFNGMSRAMFPRVSLSASPYAAASGNAPIPTLSNTTTMALWNAVTATTQDEAKGACSSARKEMSRALGFTFGVRGCHSEGRSQQRTCLGIRRNLRARLD
jgi:hypothetical protein